MEQTTAGRYRVLESTRNRDEWLLLDAESGDPTYVPSTGYDGAVADAVDALKPGNQISATLAWDDGTARFAELSVDDATRFWFARTEETLFEAAKRCWNDAVETGAAMNSRVTHDTDGEPNGVVYVFAAQPGQRDLYEEFRDGVKPLEPLLARTADAADPPFETFVLVHSDHPFVTVYIVLDPDGFLAETVRDTYFEEADTGTGGGLADRL